MLEQREDVAISRLFAALLVGNVVDSALRNARSSGHGLPFGSAHGAELRSYEIELIFKNFHIPLSG